MDGVLRRPEEAEMDDLRSPGLMSPRLPHGKADKKALCRGHWPDSGRQAG
jgi:hypothetical protein